MYGFGLASHGCIKMKGYFFGFRVLLVTLGAVGCSSESGPSEAMPSSSATTSSTTSNASSGGGSDCPHSCGAEWDVVVDCNGAVVESCEHLCDQGACVEPCTTRDPSTTGCQFVIPPSRSDYAYGGSCLAVVLFNYGKHPTLPKLRWHGKDLPTTSFTFLLGPAGNGSNFVPMPDAGIPPGSAAVMFLSASNRVPGATECPLEANVANTTMDGISNTGFINLYELRTTLPTSVVQMYPFGTNVLGSATIVHPVSSWGTSYALVDTPASAAGSSMVQLLSRTPSNVAILPSTTIGAMNGVPTLLAGATTTLPLSDDAGVQLLAPDGRLLGSPAWSNAPFGAWGGSTCWFLPDGRGTCDAEQIEAPPVSAIGSEYILAGHRRRTTDVFDPTTYEILGLVDGTLLTYEPDAPDGAPISLARGEIVHVETEDALVLRSQGADHPFYVQAMLHWISPLVPGDPELVEIPPTAQFLDDAMVYLEPTYPNGRVVLTRTTERDVDVDCNGVALSWTSIGSTGYSFAAVEMSELFAHCEGSVRRFTSLGPFSASVWGWISTGSYGYSAGQKLGTINSIMWP